jgi:hypothetical protein
MRLLNHTETQVEMNFLDMQQAAAAAEDVLRMWFFSSLSENRLLGRKFYKAPFK